MLRMAKSLSKQLVDAAPITGLMVLVTVGMTMFESARVPTLEDAVCRNFYAEHPVSSEIEHDCRSNEVQARLARLNGWFENVSALQGLILTLPYARLAESVDKHMFLCVGFVTSTASMAYFFLICHFSGPSVPLHLVVLSRVFESVGGGISMAYILLYSLLALRVPAKTRSSIFYMTGAGLLLARAFAMVICGILLKDYPWAVAPATVIAYSLNIPIILLFPSRPPKPQPTAEPASPPADGSGDMLLSGSEIEDGNGCDGQRHYYDDEESLRSATDGIGKPAMSILEHCKHVLVTTYNEYLGRAVFRISLIACGIKILGLDVQTIQAQWSVERFDWTFSAVTYVNAYATLVCMLVLAGLPSLSSYLVARLGSVRRMELVIIRGSLVLRIIGNLAMGLAPTRAYFLMGVTVQALSAGTYDTFKSFLTGLSSTGHVAELYAVISLVETAARIVSSQMWANILVFSLNLDDVLMGLPFWVSAGLGLATILTIQLMVRQLRHEPPEHTD
ncbi:major facilitator superfamily domain-containing protein [Cladorrhinum sp. PSN332]|nr:major facilitator superfamily domain-containing protein [Cladorrhinum sp. PSN332]